MSVPLIFAAILSAGAARAAGVSGGFLENQDTTVIRPPLTAAQVKAFLPKFGEFTFPAPYGTRAWRVTNASDCAPRKDCLSQIYDFWRNMSNSAGSNIMYIIVGLKRAQGGTGPTLFKLDKTTNKLTKVGPLFPKSSPLSWKSTETWFFSYSMPTKIYIPHGSKLLRYDVLTHKQVTIFDSDDYKPNTVIRGPTASNDDKVFAATLEHHGKPYTRYGCIVYFADSHTFKFFPKKSGFFSKCMIGKAGRYVFQNETTKRRCPKCHTDTVIEDLKTGKESFILDKQGGGGHWDMGYGWLLEADNWANKPHAWRLWDLSAPLKQGLTLPNGRKQGAIVEHTGKWVSGSEGSPSHVSTENAVPTSKLPEYKQYGCGGGASVDPPAMRGFEIQCFMLDSTVAYDQRKTLVVAPTMVDPHSGGGNAYRRMPKGNLDPTGHYYFFVSNHGTDREDAFIVEIPCQKLMDEAKRNPRNCAPTKKRHK